MKSLLSALGDFTLLVVWGVIVAVTVSLMKRRGKP